ncbi:hypothetical protein [Microcoleus sp. bin38.metabat.b11b12b14.051]|uniref:hypothetical protein n=1 Tax=Microcoleus sp. bin38.metabat.b11b12b14.051 TaxID=2742709 RepID=UPI0025DC6B9F|nr:hypothetical protein [Microcoleus sp. bin38.metabat.b11b12b14.051]
MLTSVVGPCGTRSGWVCRRASWRSSNSELEYRFLGKVDRNLAGKSSGAIGRGAVAARSSPPNCKMNACIYVM